MITYVASAVEISSKVLAISRNSHNPINACVSKCIQFFCQLVCDIFNERAAIENKFFLKIKWLNFYLDFHDEGSDSKTTATVENMEATSNPVMNDS